MRRLERRSPAWAGAIPIALMLGCSSTQLGSGNVTTAQARANGSDFSAPTDAAPGPDGKTIFFAATSSSGAPGIFSVSASGTTTSASTSLYSGGVLTAPIGVAVSADGKVVYVADVAAANNQADSGAVFAVAASGGTPTIVSGTEDYSPKTITVSHQGSGDVLYFTGLDKSDGQPGVFQIAAGGGTATVVAKGAPFVDPGGLTVDQHGTVYVVDSIFGGDAGHVLVVKGGATTELLAGLDIGFPGGVALSQDESALIVPVIDPAKGKDSFARIDLRTKQSALIAASVDSYAEPGGLHRAANADVYAFADSTAGTSGTVFIITK